MNFIKAELYRISRKKVFYVAFVGLLGLALFYCKAIEESAVKSVVKTALTYGTAAIPILFIPIYLQVWQTDFNSRFINNLLVSGISRIQYFWGKLLVMYLLGMIYSLGYGYGIMAFAYIFRGECLVEEFLPVMAVQMFLYLVVMTIGLMIYIIVNQAALSTAVYLLFILLFESLTSTLIKQLHMDLNRISSYMIMQNLSKAVSIMELQKNEIDSLVISGIILWIGTVCISIRVLKRREYK